jgi:hypothetical protein
VRSLLCILSLFAVGCTTSTTIGVIQTGSGSTATVNQKIDQVLSTKNDLGAHDGGKPCNSSAQCETGEYCSAYGSCKEDDTHPSTGKPTSENVPLTRTNGYKAFSKLAGTVAILSFLGGSVAGLYDLGSHKDCDAWCYGLLGTGGGIFAISLPLSFIEDVEKPQSARLEPTIGVGNVGLRGSF